MASSHITLSTCASSTFSTKSEMSVVPSQGSSCSQVSLRPHIYRSRTTLTIRHFSDPNVLINITVRCSAAILVAQDSLRLRTVSPLSPPHHDPDTVHPPSQVLPMVGVSCSYLARLYTLTIFSSASAFVSVSPTGRHPGAGVIDLSYVSHHIQCMLH